MARAGTLANRWGSDQADVEEKSRPAVASTMASCCGEIGTIEKTLISESQPGGYVEAPPIALTPKRTRDYSQFTVSRMIFSEHTAKAGE